MPEVSSAQECRFEIPFGFRLRRLAQSVVPGNRNLERHRFTGCSCTFADMNFTAGARNPSLMEVRNVSSRGRCKESDTL